MQVTVGGQQLSGWTGYRLTRGVERLPSGCVLEFTERYPGKPGKAPIAPGQSCMVSIGADLWLTGYADLYWPHLEAEHHIVRAEIRSKTCDLVDCSLIPPNDLKSWVIQQKTIGAAAMQLCQPFGITVSLPDGDAPLPQNVPFVITPGETVYQMIESLARTVQMLVWDDPQGRLVISKVGTTRATTSLVEGVNCEVEEARLSMDQRYSQIMVIGQAPIVGADGSYHLNVEGKASDPDVPRYRPLLIIMDQPGPGNQWAQQRAQWEVARRYGRSRLGDVSTSPGHRQQDGTLWQPNTIVSCSLPSLKINQDMLIAEVAPRGGEAGTSTLLSIMPKEGFMPEPFHFVGPVPDYVPQGQ